MHGEDSLRRALLDEMSHVYGRGGSIDVAIDDVTITAGCNLAFVAAVMSLADAGDEVILPVPWYVVAASFRGGTHEYIFMIQVLQSPVRAVYC